MASRYRNFLKKNNLKNTLQRKTLFDFIIRQKSHFSIDDIQENAKKKIPNLGQATVYRMIKVLNQSGEIQDHAFGEKTMFEVKNPDEHHDHLICTGCGTIVEFSSPEIEELQDQIAEEYGFTLVDHRHDLKGLCDKCKTK